LTDLIICCAVHAATILMHKPICYFCAAHTLQLVVDDRLKDGTDKIKILLEKCKKTA